MAVDRWRDDYDDERQDAGGSNLRQWQQLRWANTVGCLKLRVTLRYSKANKSAHMCVNVCDMCVCVCVYVCEALSDLHRFVYC